MTFANVAAIVGFLASIVLLIILVVDHYRNRGRNDNH